MLIKKEELRIGDIFKYKTNIYCKVIEIITVTDPVSFEPSKIFFLEAFDNINEGHGIWRKRDDELTEVELVFRDINSDAPQLKEEENDHQE